MRATIKEAKRTDMASFCGPINLVTRASSLRIIFMVLESTAGRTAESTTANGPKIKGKVVVSLLGRTAVAMKVSISTTRKKVVDVSSGLTVEAMTDIGAQAIRKALVFTTMLRARSAMVAGKTEKEHNGYQRQNSIKKPRGIYKTIMRDEQ